MTRTNAQELRLIKVVQREKERIGSFDALASAIASASGGKGIDRRKLQRLAQGTDISLRVSELKALDAYLAPLGEGLSVQPLFEQAGILAALSEAANVVFLLSSYPRTPEQRTDISSWDMRSAAEIIRDIHRYRASIHFDIEDVIYYRPGAKPPLEEEPWRKWLKDPKTSLVCIGSPRACRATEVVLGEMFDVKPFAEPVRGEKELPFYFIWRHESHMFRSRFADDGKSIRDLDHELAADIESAAFPAMGLRLGNQVFAVRQTGNAWRDYGIVAAQRRRTGQVLLVLAGLSGPSTYAAAKAVKSILAPLPSAELDAHSPVLWAGVAAAIELSDLPGDARKVITQQEIRGPRLWR